MINIDKETGCKLMKIWGLESWPDVDAYYFMWETCAVCALIDQGDFYDLHIAMKKKSRRKCREFITDVLDHCDKPIRALIETKNKHVCNLAQKMGFYYVDVYPFELLSGNMTEVIEMRNQSWEQ